jgi:hypothetical protein
VVYLFRYTEVSISVQQYRTAKMADTYRPTDTDTPMYLIQYTQKPAKTAATPHIRPPLYAKHYTSVRNRIQIPPKTAKNPIGTPFAAYIGRTKNR